MKYRLTVDFEVNAENELDKRSVMKAMYDLYPKLKMLKTFLFKEGELQIWPLMRRVKGDA